MSSDFTSNGNFTWWNTTASTGDSVFFDPVPIYSTTTTKTPDKDWMPYKHFEYDPKWHKKFANYKLQMDHMWE